MPITLPFLALALALAAAADAGNPPVSPPATSTDGRPPAEAAAPASTLDVQKLPFTPDSISLVVRAAQPQIQECYEKTLAARNEKLQGRLMTQVVITGAGTVKGAKVVKQGTTLKDKDLHACVVGVLGKLTFPRPPNAKDHPVEYPFNLQAVE
jgi:hypothetical protein